MKTLTAVAALALGAALSQQAAACDWQKEAEAKPIIIMSCGIVSGCVLEQPTDEALIFADSGCSNCAVRTTPSSSRLTSLSSSKSCNPHPSVLMVPSQSSWPRAAPAASV